MTGAAFAFAAAAFAVAGSWELLAALERARVAAWLGRGARALLRTASTPPDASRAERRRLALLSTGALLAAGWLIAGAIGAAICALGGPASAAAVLRARRKRYAEGVCRGASSAALAMGSALAAGHSVRGAITEASRDIGGPAGRELRLATRALEVGEPTERVLERLRRRAGGGPWDTLTAAILLQQAAGGDLAALLRDLAGSFDAADRARRDARAATAQSRFTAWLVAGLPVAAATLAELASPGFAGGLLEQPLSVALTAAAVVCEVTSILAIRRLGRT